MCNFVNKLNSLGEMDNFLERHKLPNFKQEKIDNTNSPIPIN